jgi:hypothetical protein
VVYQEIAGSSLRRPSSVTVRSEMSADWDALGRVLAAAGADLRCSACGQVELREDTSVMIGSQNLWLIALCDRCGFTRLHRRDTLRAAG